MMGYPQQLYTLPINAHHTISCGVQPHMVHYKPTCPWVGTPQCIYNDPPNR